MKDGLIHSVREYNSDILVATQLYDYKLISLETELKEYLESNRKVSEYLNDKEIVSLTGFVNNRRNISNDIINLQKGFNKGAIT